MNNLAKVLTGLAALAFVLALATNFVGPLLNTPPEGYSRACTNLALLAIALVTVFGDRGARAGRAGTPL
jgi:hypothetical protein